MRHQSRTGSGEGEHRNHSVLTEGGGGERWCHSPAALKGFLFSLWIPDGVHSGGAANEGAQGVHQSRQEQFLHARPWYLLEEDAKPIHQANQLKGKGLVKPQALSSNHLSGGKELRSSDKRLPDARYGTF